MKLVMIKIIFEVLLVPNKRVFRIQVNYVNAFQPLFFFFLIQLRSMGAVIILYVTRSIMMILIV